MAETVRPNAAPATAQAERPRFSWAMRLFLAVVLFNMVFRSLSVVAPWEDWLNELDMNELPTRLATLDEFRRMTPTDRDPDPVFEDVMVTCDSVWAYFQPWPTRATRRQLRSPQDWAKFGFCWLSTRFEFVENVLGINQEWPMFSPNVSNKQYVTRAELTFADGSQQTVRQLADPEDLTNYSHWFQEKILDYELHVRSESPRGSVGYCNLLAHRYAHNDQNSPLATIRLYEIKYLLAPPDVDPVEHLRQQTGPPQNQVFPIYFVYNAATRQGDMVNKN